MVLKYDCWGTNPVNLRVSVPLRGCGFKIFIFVLSKEDFIMVSVPLRGCGFKMMMMNHDNYIKMNSFRPLAGMWF